MRIAEIKTNSTAEVSGYFIDIVYFQGCDRNCCYCFNRELRDTNGGDDLTTGEVVERLSRMSSIVVFTGGEPMMQARSEKGMFEIFSLITEIQKRGKKVILETSEYNKHIWAVCDKILYCIKTWNVDEYVLTHAIQNKVIPVVIWGHSCFSKKGFKNAVKILKKIYIRSFNDEERDMTDIFNLCGDIEYEVFTQLSL